MASTTWRRKRFQGPTTRWLKKFRLTYRLLHSVIFLWLACYSDLADSNVIGESWRNLPRLSLAIMILWCWHTCFKSPLWRLSSKDVKFITSAIHQLVGGTAVMLCREPVMSGKWVCLCHVWPVCTDGLVVWCGPRLSRRFWRGRLWWDAKNIVRTEQFWNVVWLVF